MRKDTANRNLLDQSAEDSKLLCTQITIEDFVPIGVGYQGEKSRLCSECLDVRCRVGSAVAQQINRAKLQRAALEACSLITQGETALLAIRDDSRECLWRVMEHLR